MLNRSDFVTLTQADVTREQWAVVTTAVARFSPGSPFTIVAPPVDALPAGWVLCRFGGERGYPKTLQISPLGVVKVGVPPPAL